MITLNRAALALVAVVMAFPATATAQDRVHVIPGLNGDVTSVSEPAPDGTRYVAGGFSAFSAIGARGAAVVSADTGEVDKRFPQVVGSDAFLNDANVKVAVPDGSGGWYIGGRSRLSTTTESSMLRTSGATDPSTSAGDQTLTVRFSPSLSPVRPSTSGGASERPGAR